MLVFMKKKILFIIVIFFANKKGITQNNTNFNHKIEYSTGINFGTLKDLEISPTSNFKYEDIIYKLGYIRITENEISFNLQLNYLSTELKANTSPELNMDYTQIGLNFSVLKQIYNKNYFQINLGFESYSNISVYAKNNNRKNVINQSFRIASEFTYQINNKQKLFAKIVIPRILFRVSPSYKDVLVLNRYLSLLYDVGYEYSFSDNLNLNFSYEFNYNELKLENDFKEVQYQLNLGVHYMF